MAKIQVCMDEHGMAKIQVNMADYHHVPSTLSSGTINIKQCIN